MKRKEFEKELAKLQVELVRLQTWVRAEVVRHIIHETFPPTAPAISWMMMLMIVADIDLPPVLSLDDYGYSHHLQVARLQLFCG